MNVTHISSSFNSLNIFDSCKYSNPKDDVFQNLCPLLNLSYRNGRICHSQAVKNKLNTPFGKDLSVKIINTIKELHVFVNYPRFSNKNPDQFDYISTDDVSTAFHENPLNISMENAIRSKIKVVFSLYLSLTVDVTNSGHNIIREDNLNEICDSLFVLVKRDGLHLWDSADKIGYANSTTKMIDFFSDFVYPSFMDKWVNTSKVNTRTTCISNLSKLSNLVVRYHGILYTHRCNFNNISQFSRSEIEARNLQIRSQIDYITSRLDEHQKALFSDLLFIEPVNTYNDFSLSSMMVLGDGDGSFLREILLVMHAGIVVLNQDGLDAIVECIKIEVEVLSKLNQPRLTYSNVFDILEDYQGNNQMKIALEKVFKNISVQEAHRFCASIGDNRFDRLSVTSMMLQVQNLRTQFYSNGMIYIRGNHDDIRTALLNSNPIFADFKLSHAWRNMYNYITHGWIFNNGFYHDYTNTLLVHNGFSVSNTLSNHVTTAFGDIKIDSDVQNFVNNLNKRDADSFNFTSFRPNIAQIQEAAMYSGFNCSVACGHNGSKQIQGNVTIVNSREGEFLLYKPAATVIYPQCDNQTK